MSMVSNDKHIFGVLFVARLLGGLVFLFGEVFLSLFFVFLFFFKYFWTGCLPASFGQRHDPYFIFDFHFVFQLLGVRPSMVSW